MAFDANDGYSAWECDADNGQATDELAWRKGNRRRGEQSRRAQATAERGRDRAAVRRGPSCAAREGREEFRCRHCRALIGPTLCGGKHRNHCPLCLHSRHVDDRRPGDRASECGSLMAPVGRFARPNGEPMLVHRCLGCGKEGHNRVAADDAVALLTRLPLVRVGRVGEEGVSERVREAS